MDIFVLIDKLDDAVHKAKRLPLSDQVRVDREEIYDILDQMRAAVPEEIKAAALEPRLDHCAIGVSDWERANGFWRDVVGAELVPLPRGLWAYRFDQQLLTVHGPGASPEPSHTIPPGAGHVAFVWRGPITEAVEHLVGCGVALELGPVGRGGRLARCDAGPGVRRGQVVERGTRRGLHRHGRRARLRRRRDPADARPAPDLALRHRDTNASTR